MPVFKRNGPLPDGHPFKGMRVLFMPRSGSSSGQSSDSNQPLDLQNLPFDPAAEALRLQEASGASETPSPALRTGGRFRDEKNVESAVESPWYFEVRGSGTIVDPSFAEPEVRRDVFRVSTDWIDTPQELIREVDRCIPLCMRFQELAAGVVEEIRDQLDSEELDDRSRIRLERLEAVLGDEDDGWKAWVRYEGKRDLPRLLKAVEDWLDEPINWYESDWFRSDWGGQGHALTFFESLDSETLDALGVDIVMGDHPGSSYYAAELSSSVEEANAAAERLGLPFRFRQEEI